MTEVIAGSQPHKDLTSPEKPVDQQSGDESPRPWWKEAHVWLVISFPLTAVLMSIPLIYIAHGEGRETLVDQDYYQRGLEMNKHLREAKRSMAPAGQARNHVATPVELMPNPNVPQEEEKDSEKESVDKEK